jgi:type 1 fimbria pilin
MVKRNIIILSAALLLLAGSALAQDVSGEWEITSEGRQGPQTQTFTIVQDGEKITVTMEGRMGEMTGEGTIKDNKIEWKITRETQRGEFTQTYTGTVDGDTMSGEMQMSMGNRPASEWTAKKK